MKVLPFAFATFPLLSPVAQADVNTPGTLTGSTVLPSTGVGQGGQVLLGSHGLSLVDPNANVYIETGSDPDRIITFTIDLTGIDMDTSTSPPTPRRGWCVLEPAWTEPEYADGLAIPDWPEVFHDQAAYTITPTQVTATYRFASHAPGFQPHSNYEVIMVCGARGH